MYKTLMIIKDYIAVVAIVCMCRAVCAIDSNCYAKSNQNSCKTAASSLTDRSASVTSSHGGSMALVLYDDSKVLHMYRDKRNFTFGKHVVVINQDWSGGGVAAVVWDAVSITFELVNQYGQSKLYRAVSRPAQYSATARRSLPNCETALPSGDGCAVARQYSQAVTGFAQSLDDVTPLSAIKNIKQLTRREPPEDTRLSIGR